MRKKKSFFRQLVQRYDQESPDFFKRLFRFGRVLVAGAASILGPDIIFPGVKIPDFILIIAGHVGIAGLVIMGVSKAATKKDDEDVEAPKPKENE